MFGSRRHVHIVNPFWDAAGGSEWRGLSLYEALRGRCPVSLWSEAEPSPLLSRSYPFKRINPRRLRFPFGGTLVFVGVYFRVGSWVRYARPQRLVLIYNTNQPNEFFDKLRRFSAAARGAVEVVYSSEWIKETVGHPGPVQISLIDLERFSPPTVRARREFTVGRLSRPVARKHHAEDAALYRELAARGCRVRVMGAPDFLTAEVGDVKSVELLPTCTEEPQEFLRGLDCFFYRTSETYTEPWGRVVTEAMACGLPVVCHRRGGYAELIEHARNGFLFDTQEEALQTLLRLKEDAARRESIGRAARATAEQLFSPARRAEVARFFCPEE